MGIVCVFVQYFVTATTGNLERSPDNNFKANIAERCDSMCRHLVFYASSVQIMFTEMKENLVLNFK